jgi:NADH:ubiquinone oxidoreductase subunit K
MEISLTTLATEKGLATGSSGMEIQCALLQLYFIPISIGTEISLGLVIGLLVAFLIILIAAASVTICLATIVIRKRKDKATIRSLQLEVLTRSIIV